MYELKKNKKEANYDTNSKTLELPDQGKCQ